MARQRISTADTTGPQPSLWRDLPPTHREDREKNSSGPSLSSGGLIIDHLVMHYLDTDKQKPDLTDVDANLDEAMHAYFAQQIQHAEANAEWHAEFADPSHNVLQTCTSLLRGEATDFAQTTHHFANCLFDIMGGRGRFKERIAAGDMVVALYHEVDTALQKLAILKVQPDLARHIREFTQDGEHRVVVFKPATNLLPRVESLQKCAVMWFETDEAMPTLKLLDKDAGPASAGVAAFFYHDFLGASLGMSPRRRTRLFWSETNAWINTHSSTFLPSDLLGFYQVRRTALGGVRIDIEHFISAALPNRMQDAQDLRQALIKKLDLSGDSGVFDFEIDPEAAKSYTENVVIQLDGKMKLSVRSDVFSELVQVSDDRTANGKIVITIESRTFQETNGR